MAEKSNPQAGDESPAGSPMATPPTPATPAATEPALAAPKKEAKPSKAQEPASPFSSSSQLVICRNKHWRYIACFHGPWLQMPLELLESMASINYNTPRPHPIDPAVLFDVVKIRRLVEEATDLAVRAANDLQGGSGGNSSLGGPGSNPHGSRLSREWKYRMNLQACQKLARAYRLDEIACSVATMQGSSTLDKIGSTVLQRDKEEKDGKYVHFFHEKIPSRQLADHTSLRPLNEIILALPTDPEPYRTRAMIRGFMLDFEGAIRDFGEALDMHKRYGKRHGPVSLTFPSRFSVVPQNGHANGKRPPDVRLREEDQPSSLEPQLYFMRAGAYLALACENVRDTVKLTPAEFSELPQSSFMSDTAAAASSHDSNLPRGHSLLQRPEMGEEETLALRRTVKTNARRALKDLHSFLSHLEYTPHLPQEAVADFTDKVSQATSKTRSPRLVQTGKIAPAIVYKMAELFSEKPPTGMPPYPPADGEPPAKATTSEACTYHPLLTEALHSLLLCHFLLQTSKTELIRHAHNVARLARIADAYPVFQASRSAARADFVDILEKTGLASAFSHSWDALCAPAPLPAVPHPSNCGCEGHEEGKGAGAKGMAAGRALTRWSVADDGKEYPIVTDRALLIAKWWADVPFVRMGPGKKKKMVFGKGKGGGAEGGGGSAA